MRKVNVYRRHRTVRPENQAAGSLGMEPALQRDLVSLQCHKEATSGWALDSGTQYP